MAKTKTIVLTGEEAELSGLGGQNVAVMNLGAGAVYASVYSGIVADADDVIEIPAGSGVTVLDAHGKVYLLGSGKVQCTGTDYATMTSSTVIASGGSGGTGDVTKGYVDAQDTTNLGLAKAYTDAEVGAVKPDIEQNAADISELKTGVASVSETANAAQSAANAANAAAATAQSTADTNKGNISALQAAMTTAQGDISANAAAVADNNRDIGKLQSDLSTAQTNIAEATAKAENADTKATAAQTKSDTNASDISELKNGVEAATTDIETLQTAKADKTEIPIVSNPTLLDNGYFADPINQRGQQEYTGTGYMIDRWAVFDNKQARLTLVEKSHLSISFTEETTTIVGQVIPDPEQYMGKTLTFSVLTADNELYSSTSTLKTADESVDGPQPHIGDTPCRINVFYSAPNKRLFARFISAQPIEVNIVAVKLELGDKQTLAHQDESGKWVLNDPPPNKALELLKCQRYYQIRSTNDIAPVDLRPTMYKTPTDIKPVEGGYAYVAEL